MSTICIRTRNGKRFVEHDGDRRDQELIYAIKALIDDEEGTEDD